MGKSRYSIFRLFNESGESWPGLALAVFLTLLTAFFRTTADRLLGKMVDYGLMSQIGVMLKTGAFLLLILAVDGVRTACYNRVVAVTTEKMFLKYRVRFFDVLTHGKISELEQKMKTGDVVSRMNSDIETLCETIAAQYGWYLKMILEAVAAVIWSLFISWQLALIYFCILPVTVLILNKISTPLQKQQKLAAVHTGNSMNIATDTLMNLETVKAFSLEERMNQKFGAYVDQTVVNTLKSRKIKAGITGIQYVFDMLQLMILMVLAVILVENSWMTVGAVVSFFMLSNRVRAALSLTDLIIVNVRKSEVLCQRMYEVLDLSVETGGSALDPEGDECLRMEGLAFSYSDDIKIFQNLNMHISQGKKIGIVGPSGSGKSTIMKLICKFYDPTAGKLELFGHPVQEWSHESLRENLALVSQSPSLFDGTIYENVVYGKADASEEEVIQALKDARLWEFVESLPEKQNTPIGEYGARLSGGQKQRLSIARAIVKGAKLIILDEPTSALDTQTEYELKEALDSLLSDKAAIIIAHRLRTLEHADYIYCLNEQGEIAEEGTWEALLDRKGYFYKMKNMQ